MHIPNTATLSVFLFTLATTLANASISDDLPDDNLYAQAQQYRLLMADAYGRSWEGETESTLRLSAQIQTRYVLSNRSNAAGDDLTTGFEARRTKLKATGRLVDPRFRYTVAMALSRSTGAMTIEDVYTRWKMNDNWTLKFGQFRPSVLREQIISSKYQIGVERSLLASAFGQRYNRGVALRYSTDQLRLTASVMDVTTNDTVVTDDDWEYLIRGEFMITGKRSEISDFTSFRDDSPATMIGAGVNYRDADPTDPLNPDFTLLTWSADLTAEFGGSSLFIAVMGSTLDEAGASTVDRFGLLVQGSVFVNDSTELFARYSHGDEEGDQSLNLVELGVNHYIQAHNAKLTVDVGYSFDEITRAWRSTSSGWLRDTAGEEGQFVLRSQIQLLF